MLLTSARRVPDIAFDSRESSITSNDSVPLLFSTLTRPFSGWVRVPSGPLTVIDDALIATSVPAGTAIGILATRDIVYSLSHVAKHFATDAGCTCFTVGHHTLRGRDDCDAQAVHDLRDLVLALVDAQARTGNALDALDNRTANVIFQTDVQFRLATFGGHGEIFDVTLVLQDVGDRNFHFRRRHRHVGLLHALCVADAGQHIGDRIAHTHCLFSYYQLALVIPGISPFMANSRSLVRARPNLRKVPRGRPVMAQRLRWRVGAELRGRACSFRRAS